MTGAHLRSRMGSEVLSGITETNDFLCREMDKIKVGGQTCQKAVTFKTGPFEVWCNFMHVNGQVRGRVCFLWPRRQSVVAAFRDVSREDEGFVLSYSTERGLRRTGTVSDFVNDLVCEAECASISKVVVGAEAYVG